MCYNVINTQQLEYSPLFQITYRHHRESLLVGPLEVQALKLPLCRIQLNSHHRTVRHHFLQPQRISQRTHEPAMSEYQVVSRRQSRKIVHRAPPHLHPVLPIWSLVLQTVHLLLLLRGKRVEVHPLVLPEIQLTQTRLHRNWPVGKSEGKVERVPAANQIGGVQVRELAAVAVQGAEKFVCLLATLDGKFGISPADYRSCVIR